MKQFGLTGNIGAGKSTVAELLRQHGIAVIDMDQIGRELNDAQTVAAVRQALGDHVVTPSGHLDRSKIKTLIFNDASLRKKLEAVLHPRISAAYQERAEAERKKGASVVVCEAALLYETGRYKTLDGLIVVTAPLADRKRRVMERDKMEGHLFDSIARAQVSQEEKARVATFLLENHGDPADLARQVKSLVTHLR